MTKSKLFVPIAFALITGAGVAGLGYLGYLYPPYQKPKIVYIEIEKSPTFKDLLDAIEWVESRGNPYAVGDNGAAIGAYQIHKIYVDDVNRIVGKKLFTYDDRYNRVLSRAMCSYYLGYWLSVNSNEIIKSKVDTFEALARIHNGGPNGYKKECTKPYWEKVKRAIDLIEEALNAGKTRQIPKQLHSQMQNVNLKRRNHNETI